MTDPDDDQAELLDALMLARCALVDSLAALRAYTHASLSPEVNRKVCNGIVSAMDKADHVIEQLPRRADGCRNCRTFGMVCVKSGGGSWWGKCGHCGGSGHITT